GSFNIVKEDGTYKFTLTNTAKTGSLKVKKTVTENGKAPSTDGIKSKLAGTYKFGVYTDSDCRNAYMVDGEPLVIEVTVPDTGEAAYSEEISGLPAGKYWIKEVRPTNGSNPTKEIVEVTVKAGEVGEEAVIAS